MPLEHLRVERRDDGVALLTLDNPGSAQRDVGADDGLLGRCDRGAAGTIASVRAVVVTGEGPAFCSGGDTSWIVSEPDATVDAPAHPDGRLLPRLAVDPVARGADASPRSTAPPSAPGCAWRWRATSGTPPGRRGSGAPFVRLGMHPGMAATWLLPEAVGLAAARDLLLTGRTVDADEALRLGLVSRVVDDGSFRDEVLGARCRDRGDGTHRQPAHQARARRRRPRDVRRGAAVGGAWPSP